MVGNEAQARDLATTFRQKHNLEDRPLGDLFELAAVLLGCDVLAMQSPAVEHGLTAQDPAGGTSGIAVAATPHPMRQRSSIAHEIGHLLAGDPARSGSARPGVRTDAEIRADAFARHLLLPLSAVRRRAAGVSDPEELLAQLVQDFGLSPLAAAIQMAEAKVVTRSLADQLGSMASQQLAARFGWLSQYKAMAAASQQERAPQRLMRRAVRAYQQGLLSLEEIALWYDGDAQELRLELGEPDLGSELDLDDEAPLIPAHLAHLFPPT